MVRERSAQGIEVYRPLDFNGLRGRPPASGTGLIRMIVVMEFCSQGEISLDIPPTNDIGWFAVRLETQLKVMLGR